MNAAAQPGRPRPDSSDDRSRLPIMLFSYDPAASLGTQKQGRAQ